LPHKHRRKPPAQGRRLPRLAQGVAGPVGQDSPGTRTEL
jgi:hypothetical protein